MLKITYPRWQMPLMYYLFKLLKSLAQIVSPNHTVKPLILLLGEGKPSPNHCLKESTPCPQRHHFISPYSTLHFL